MIINELVKKLKGVLTEEDLVSLESSIKKLIEESVALKVEEQKNLLEDEAAKEAVKIIIEKVEEAKQQIDKEYEEKLKTLEESIVNKLDQFLDSEILEKISDKTIEKIAINETYKPIVDGIMKLFEEQFVALDTEGYAILREAKEELEKYENQASELIAEKMELSKQINGLKTKNLLLEKTNMLTESQKERVSKFFEGKDFAEVSEKIDTFISLLNESTNSANKDEKNIINEDTRESETLEEPKKKNIETTSEIASRLL
ncbi:MAG: hypothetical protein QXG00_06605 [Candidatus Woesearchaeota archaeon]